MEKSLPLRLLLAALAFEIAMVMAYWADLLLGQPYWTVSALLDLNGEGTIPAWFSSVQLAFLSATLYLLRHVMVGESRRRWLGIGLLATMALFFSVDEMLSIHERLNDMLISVAWFPRFKYNNGLWLPLYLVMLIAVAGACAGDFIALGRRYPAPILAMGAGVSIALLGAVLLEILSYQYLFQNQGGFWYLLEVGVEEMLEMAGVSLLLFGAMAMLASELEKRSAVSGG